MIQVQLETIGSDNEFVWIEIHEQIAGDITASAYHTERTEGLLNTALNGAIGAVAPIPIPFDLFNLYNSQSNPTQYIAFTPDSCQTQLPFTNGQGFQLPDCSLTGTNTIVLSEDVDIRSGFFTLGYTEGDLVKMLTFRMSDHDAKFVNEAELDNLCQNFPLNSQCRYWPLSTVELSQL